MRATLRRPGLNQTIVRSFRLLRPLPVTAEFFAMQYTLDVIRNPHTADRETLIVRLPWDRSDQGREITHAGQNVIRRALNECFDVELATFAEVLFLRLVRQGDAIEVAGPHWRICWRNFDLMRG